MPAVRSNNGKGSAVEKPGGKAQPAELCSLTDAAAVVPTEEGLLSARAELYATGPGLCSLPSEEEGVLPLTGVADAWDDSGVDFSLLGEGEGAWEGVGVCSELLEVE